MPLCVSGELERRPASRSRGRRSTCGPRSSASSRRAASAAASPVSGASRTTACTSVRNMSSYRGLARIVGGRGSPALAPVEPRVRVDAGERRRSGAPGAPRPIAAASGSGARTARRSIPRAARASAAPRPAAARRVSSRHSESALSHSMPSYGGVPRRASAARPSANPDARRRPSRRADGCRR